MTERNGDNRMSSGGTGPHLESELVSAVIDGAVPEADRTRVEDHLASCADCRAAVAETRLLISTLAELPLPRAPRSFTLSPDAALAREPWWRRIGLRLLPALPALRAGTVAAALLLTAVTASDILQEEDQQATVIRQATALPTGTVLVRAPDADSAAPTATAAALTRTPLPTEAAANVTVLPTSPPLAEETQQVTSDEQAERSAADSEEVEAEADAAEEESDAASGDESLEQSGLGESDIGDEEPASASDNAADREASGDDEPVAESSEDEEPVAESAPGEEADTGAAADADLEETSGDAAGGDTPSESIEMVTVSALTATPIPQVDETAADDAAPTELISFAAPEEASPAASPAGTPATPSATAGAVASPLPALGASPTAIAGPGTIEVIVDAGDDDLAWRRVIQAALAALLIGLGGLATVVGRLRRQVTA